MTFLQMKQRLAIRRGAASGTLVAATDTRYGQALNEAHRSVLRRPGMEALRYATVPFASVDGRKLYALPHQGVARINRIMEATNDRRLVYRTPDWLDAQAPDPTTGTPWAWVPRGSVDVHTQPSDASAVFVDSTSASDTGTCYLEGITTGGYYRSVSVVMTGTTAVNVSAAVSDWIVITKFYLSTAAVGVVTLHEDASGGTELSKIAIGDTRASFSAFQLYQTPSAVITYTADILRQIPEMTNDTDECLLPVDFEDLLLDMAEMKELRKTDDPNRWQMLRGDIEDGKAALASWMTGHPDWRPTFHDATYDEPSSLGAWFPAGT